MSYFLAENFIWQETHWTFTTKSPVFNHGTTLCTLTNYFVGKAELNSWERSFPKSASLKHHTLFPPSEYFTIGIKLYEFQRGQVIFQLHTAEVRCGLLKEGLYSFIHSLPQTLFSRYLLSICKVASSVLEILVVAMSKINWSDSHWTYNLLRKQNNFYSVE